MCGLFDWWVEIDIGLRQSDKVIRIISARKANKKEVKIYKEYLL